MQLLVPIVLGGLVTPMAGQSTTSVLEKRINSKARRLREARR
jgi:hypothetical protein